MALGLVAYAVVRREEAGSAWVGLATGGALLGLTHVVLGSGLALDSTWPLYARVGAYASIAVGAAGRATGTSAPVVIAAAPIAAHVAAAIAGIAAAVASLRGVLARSESTILLAGGLVGWAAADALASESATAAGVVSLAGSVAVAGWLSGRARASLMTRFLAAFLLVLLVLVVGLSAAAGVIFGADLEREQLDRLDQVGSARAQQWEREWPQELQAIASAFTGDRVSAELQTASETGASLDSRAATVAQLPGVDIVMLVTIDGAVVGSYDALRAAPLPRADELLLAGDATVERALTGDTTASAVALGQRDLLVVSAAPAVPTVDGVERHDLRRGVIVVGRRVTDPRVLNAIVALAGADATVVIGGSVATSTLPPPQYDELVQLVRVGEGSRTVRLADQPRFLSVEPIRDADGGSIADLVVTLDASAVAGVQRDLMRSLFLAVIVGLAVAAGLAAVVARRITHPVQQLTAAAEHVAAGDLETSVSLDEPDEIGRLATAFNGMTVALRGREAELVSAATTEAELRGRLEVVTASMGEALIAADRDGRVRTANPAAAELLGTERSKLIGARITRVLRGVDDTGAPMIATLGAPDAKGTVAMRGAVGE
ncbi:MAG TPA: HAMP domain-containing protein, partial [Nitriliruptorales bacterium]